MCVIFCYTGKCHGKAVGIKSNYCIPTPCWSRVASMQSKATGLLWLVLQGGQKQSLYLGKAYGGVSGPSPPVDNADEYVHFEMIRS